MRRTLHRRIRRSAGGLNLVADVNAVVASGTAPAGDANVVSSRQRVRIVQRNRRATTDATNRATEAADRPEAAGETGENR